MEQTYFRKGFGLRRDIADELSADYHSQLVERIREDGHGLTVGTVTVRLAKVFGFCYGVDRAVEYAYETRKKFPGKRLFLVGEIIHNPHVNRKLESMGITIVERGDTGGFDFQKVVTDDVVLIPAFGVTVEDFELLREKGCVLVDTTCGSVLNVWKRVERYAKEGFTAIVHGKHFHEETKATVSQVTRIAGGRYLIVRNMNEAEMVCRFIEDDADPDPLTERFRDKVSEGFDFSRDLERAGLANQTTMLATESLAIGERIGKAMATRYGESSLDEHLRNFDTICSATQERQDAVIDLIEEPLDIMVVIGGYNSSNTNNLARICSSKRRSYHISDASCIDPESGTIRFKPVGGGGGGGAGDGEVEESGWLDAPALTVGITAGASTPNNKIGEAIERILATKGLEVPA